MRKHKYGVGFGTALKSRTIGTLNTAAAELKRLITAGLDPRRLTIVPAIRCPVCKGKGEHHNKVYSEMCEPCSGFGWVVLNGLRYYTATRENNRLERNAEALSADKPGPRVSFMSAPTTTADDRRTYLVRFTGEQPEIVRVYTTPALQFVCNCATASDGDDCKHTEAARVIDGRKFAKEGNKPND